MAEQLWVFTEGERLLTMTKAGAAVAWEVQPDGSLHMTWGSVATGHQHTWIGGPPMNDRHCSVCGVYAEEKQDGS